MWLERWRRSEDGAGLIVAMLATLIVSGMVVVFVTRTLTETRLSSSARDREAAIHVAEGGIDNVLVSINGDDTYVTSRPDGAGEHTIDLSTHDTLEAERSWAIDVATDPDACAVVDVGVGEACGIRPRSSAGATLPWVYGVGFIPSRAAPEKTRVIKIQYDKGFFAPAAAILTNGSLTFNGSVCGSSANVHSNGDVTVGGNGDTTSCADPDGQVTASGSYSNSGGTVGADSGEVDRTETIPSISAIEVYRKEAAREHAREKWYDLCPDGTVHRPLVDASGELVLDASGDPQPCQGPEVYDSTDAATHLGWQLQSSQNRWDVSTTQVPDAAYFVHEGDVMVRGDMAVDVNMTVLVNGTGTIDGQPDTGDGCTRDGSDNGNIRFGGIGSGNYNPYLQDLLFLADRDIVGQGNSSVSINGVILAHEQVDFGGTVTFRGAVVAEGACDSPGSPVSMNQNRVTGNFEITYDEGQATPLDSPVARVTAWNEL